MSQAATLETSWTGRPLRDQRHLGSGMRAHFKSGRNSSHVTAPSVAASILAHEVGDGRRGSRSSRH